MVDASAASAQAYREKMRDKAARLSGGRDAEKVGASDFTPAEKLYAGVKTGMRPISRQARKGGGQVRLELPPEGEHARHRPDRAARAKGGGFAEAFVNRDQKAANAEREGEYPNGGMKKGGRAKRDLGGVLEKISPAYMLGKALFSGGDDDADDKGSGLAPAKPSAKGGRAKRAGGGGNGDDPYDELPDRLRDSARRFVEQGSPTLGTYDAFLKAHKARGPDDDDTEVIKRAGDELHRKRILPWSRRGRAEGGYLPREGGPSETRALKERSASGAVETNGRPAAEDGRRARQAGGPLAEPLAAGMGGQGRFAFNFPGNRAQMLKDGGRAKARERYGKAAGGEVGEGALKQHRAEHAAMGKHPPGCSCPDCRSGRADGGRADKDDGASAPATPRYNRDAVQKAIDRDPRIKGREARMIHAVLKGRQREDRAKGGKAGRDTVYQVGFYGKGDRKVGDYHPHWFDTPEAAHAAGQREVDRVKGLGDKADPGFDFAHRYSVRKTSLPSEVAAAGRAKHAQTQGHDRFSDDPLAGKRAAGGPAGRKGRAEGRHVTPKRSFDTEDGIFHELPNGRIVDNVDPDLEDQSWPSHAHMVKDLGYSPPEVKGRARGGKAGKGKTNINIVIAPGGMNPQQAAAPPPPPAGPPPGPPPMRPPGMPMPPGGPGGPGGPPPAAMPMPIPIPGAQGPAGPPGPPGMRARGGRAPKAGAGSGLGRLQKIKAYGDRSDEGEGVK